MKTIGKLLLPVFGIVVVAALVSRSDAQVRAWSSNVIVPQSRSFAADRRQCIEITGVKAGVVILEQAATTTMDICLRNPTSGRLEAELLAPVPEGAAVRGFTFEGAGAEPSATLLPKSEAVATYNSIVAKIKDPALLEFAGYNLIRSSVFPVEANGTQKIRLTYEHLLESDGERVDYLLPRTESIDYDVPWEVSIAVKSKRPISTVYSPSHQVDVRRQGKNRVSVKIGADRMREPGPLQLSYLMEGRQAMTASLISYPDPKIDGGYFLLLAGLPARVPDADDDGEPDVLREVTLVIDRSGSMAGEKIEQAKAAALQVLQGLREGEAFNVIDYSDSIASFASAPVVKNRKNAEEARRYIRRLSSNGGTNIHDTLLEALRPRPIEGMLPIVLFLTDGLATVGVTDETAIRTAAMAANDHERRIFTFGVGYNVNAPLLVHLAQKSRAVSTFVLPGEDIEAKVSQVYRRLYGPVLAGPELAVVDSDGKVTTRRVADLMPGTVPDLFEGDQLVLLGKYTGSAPLHFRLAGDFHGKPRQFRFDFNLDKSSAKNGFVPRLWATRKIAMLVDEIQQSGATSAPAASMAALARSNVSFRAVAMPQGNSASTLPAAAAANPKMKELVDEIVRLSIEFGVLTEYTAFLAREGSDLTARDAILGEANGNFLNRAVATRSGIGGVNQALNYNFQRGQVFQNRRNAFYDANMNRVQVSRVQQINGRGFFRQGDRWVDGNALNNSAGPAPDRTVQIGSPEFAELLDGLVAGNDQGALAMSGEIVVRIGDENVLITGQ